MSLRRKGQSIRLIESELGIPRSTLSGWFKNVELTERQKQTLERHRQTSFIEARKKAVLWHNQGKAERLAIAKNQADHVLSLLSVSNKESLELALAFLYLGEGGKGGGTSLASSNPEILVFFTNSLLQLYGVEPASLKYYLHLRADQDPIVMTKYWTKKLGVPASAFGKASIDQRTAGRKTYDHYKGVCMVCCSRVEIQRRLMYIANGFIEAVSKTKGD